MRIVYNSFHGRYSCNTRSLYERLAGRPGTEHVWLADPEHQAAFPSDVRTVDINGPESRRLLESADLLISNTHTEVEWEKAAGTTYLQTWHGTPLKRIHNDVLWAPEGRLRRLDGDIARWDLLLSPNAVSSPRLTKAFAYDRLVAETGYPRNDSLLAPDADRVRQEVRESLGIGPGMTVVLYTPTWRDDECFVDASSEIRLALDPAEFVEAMGPDHVLLVRSHNMVTGRSRLDAVRGVLDVSYYPDVSELYLAADVLVTDYSSTMFDFAVTGKPMVFFTYDLDRFASAVRGFYFDFTADAPGPLVSTPEELTETLHDLPAIEGDYAERYATFRDTYCHLEDGAATERVVRLLGL
ncbi:CDP-glycerol glycerophosphotransferase family protein [Pedococcus sp. 5OH_020]|uniref:CDP-glycerol glycerophosphotransferase family protein n=1 Tax=Pedococcus sp. 5OH_020 TaxID=2989814 RepID=UPI0022E9D0C6|nr:CDP-glycerol glycerophosphotransferase family protein [Pedococcus sp. 5OH_020]